MAFRGRGRGRGRGGYGGGPLAKQLPFELFPEIEALGTASDVKEAKTLAVWYYKFEKYYKSSPYYIEDEDDSSKKFGTELETFSNWGSEKNGPKGRLSDFINMDPIYVPAELAKGDKKGRHGVKRVRWNPISDAQQLDDLFKKKLQDYKNELALANIVKKEGEEAEEEEEINAEDEVEYSTEGDYSQNEDFDDDDDEYNTRNDNNDDEPSY